MRCKKIDGQVLNPFADVIAIKRGNENCEISGNFHGANRMRSTRNARAKHARKYAPYTASLLPSPHSVSLLRFSTLISKA